MKATYATSVEHPDRDQARLLGNTVRARADGARNVGAVPDQVNKSRVRIGIVAEGRAPLELDVGRQQAGVDDVGVGADASLGVVDIISRALPLVGDGAQAPGRVGLRGQLVELPDGVLLDGSDLLDC